MVFYEAKGVLVAEYHVVLPEIESNRAYQFTMKMSFIAVVKNLVIYSSCKKSSNLINAFKSEYL
jgi:hypothetical protein